MVVREWSPETDLDPLDLYALPMWIDLKGVPNLLFLHKGLKCLSRVAGKFVKLHPNTERCTTLDVARILVDRNHSLFLGTPRDRGSTNCKKHIWFAIEFYEDLINIMHLQNQPYQTRSF